MDTSCAYLSSGVKFMSNHRSHCSLSANASDVTLRRHGGLFLPAIAEIWLLDGTSALATHVTLVYMGC